MTYSYNEIHDTSHTYNMNDILCAEGAKSGSYVQREFNPDLGRGRRGGKSEEGVKGSAWISCLCVGRCGGWRGGASMRRSCTSEWMDGWAGQVGARAQAKLLPTSVAHTTAGLRVPAPLLASPTAFACRLPALHRRCRHAQTFYHAAVPLPAAAHVAQFDQFNNLARFRPDLPAPQRAHDDADTPRLGYERQHVLGRPADAPPERRRAAQVAAVPARPEGACVRACVRTLVDDVRGHHGGHLQAAAHDLDILPPLPPPPPSFLAPHPSPARPHRRSMRPSRWRTSTTCTTSSTLTTTTSSLASASAARRRLWCQTITSWEVTTGGLPEISLGLWEGGGWGWGRSMVGFPTGGDHRWVVTTGGA
eukprot:264309-Chlamydomonas_euryale.AAC.6